MKPSVSVIIPAFNCGKYIVATLESLLAQSVVADEIVVVDDGSTDDAADVVGRFGESVRYVYQENAGVSAARNRGVRESSGDFIAFLDADDTWESTKLEKQLSVFASDQEIGLIHCGIREFGSESGVTIGYRTLGKSGWVSNDILLWEGPAVNVSGSSVAVSRSAFDEVGGFDSRIKVGEDWDLCYRVAKKCKVGFVPEPLVNYRIHEGGAHKNVRNMEIGMGLFYEKAFDTDDVEVLRLKNRAMSNYHRVLSGSYLYAGNYGQALRHALKSIARRPAAAAYFLKTPFRRLSRTR